VEVDCLWLVRKGFLGKGRLGFARMPAGWAPLGLPGVRMRVLLLNLACRALLWLPKTRVFLPLRL
jgi:hypothetical protein